MVQHAILQRRVMVVLTIQVFADHLNVSLLTHLFWGFHAKTDVASKDRKFQMYVWAYIYMYICKTTYNSKHTYMQVSQNQLG